MRGVLANAMRNFRDSTGLPTPACANLTEAYGITGNQSRFLVPGPILELLLPSDSIHFSGKPILIDKSCRQSRRRPTGAAASVVIREALFDILSVADIEAVVGALKNVDKVDGLSSLSFVIWLWFTHETLLGDLPFGSFILAQDIRLARFLRRIPLNRLIPVSPGLP